MSRTEVFRDLHGGPGVLLMPNPWDVGSARLLESLGFTALATTSGGAAAARGRPDGGMTGDDVLRHAADIVAAVDLPVSADLENGFADDPAGVAATIRRAVEVGLAGASVEDWDGRELYGREHAADRVAAAVQAAAGRLVVTARAENHFRGVDDLEDTSARLRAFAAAGADVVFAPGITTADQIRSVVAAVDVPVSVLAFPGVPPVSELADLGVRRMSTGGAFAYSAYAALLDAAAELRDLGTYGYLAAGRRGGAAVRKAFG